MNTWQGAWFLAKEDYKKAGWKHLITIIFIGYLTMFYVQMFISALDEKEGMGLLNWSMDLVTVTLLPLLGLMSTQTTRYYWRTDAYTKKLAALRTMPITIKQIVWGRLLLLFTNALPALTLFFIIFYIVGRLSSSTLDPVAFIVFAVFWISFAISGSMLYTYIEIGFSGKYYFWFCMIVSIGILAGMLICTFLLEISLVISSYRYIEDGGWWLAVIGPAAAAVVLLFIRPLMEKKLRTRNYISN